MLARRSDLSTFLVHLTRSREEITAKDALISILKSRTIKAISPLGQAVSRLAQANQSADSQKCVCLTETPIEHVSLLTGNIDNRNCQFDRYGVALTKKQARRLGANPVWYVDITPGHNWLTVPLNSLIDKAIATGAFAGESIAQIAPFIEQMGSGPAYRKEFWWEREWRVAGSLSLPKHFMVLCPEGDFPDVEAVASGLPLIDPAWSLEQIIGHLGKFAASDIGPL